MVENFGSYLKHERELRGVPLEEIAEVTKVHIRFLEALENNEFDQLPGEVFIKGYIRSYAKVIGLDSEEMVNAYDESVGKDRKRELDNARLASEKNHSRKKNLLGYIIGGIGLAGVLVVGYFGVGTLVDKGNNGGVLKTSTTNGVEPDTLSPLEAPDEDEVSREKESAPELQARLSQEAPALPAVKAKPKPEVKKSKPVATDSKLKDKPSSPSKAKKAKPEAPVPTIPKETKPEVEKKKPVIVDSKLKVKPTPPREEKTEEPETSEKPSETQKVPAPSEKPVIIQHVASDPKEAESSSETPEADSKPLHLMIQAQGNSWFNVTVDDGGEADFILPSGSNKNFYGNEKFRVTVGNRRGTLIFLNGQSIDLPFGTSDVIRDFEITAKLIE